MLEGTEGGGRVHTATFNAWDCSICDMILLVNLMKQSNFYPDTLSWQAAEIWVPFVGECNRWYNVNLPEVLQHGGCVVTSLANEYPPPSRYILSALGIPKRWASKINRQQMFRFRMAFSSPFTKALSGRVFPSSQLRKPSDSTLSFISNRWYNRCSGPFSGCNTGAVYACLCRLCNSSVMDGLTACRSIHFSLNEPLCASYRNFTLGGE